MNTSSASGRPATHCETLVWISRGEHRRDRNGPYEAAVTPAIAQATVLLPTALADAIAEATAALRVFDASVEAEYAPLASVLLRTEAVASSRIEGLTASSRALAEAHLGEGSRANASMIVANVTAMEAAVALSDCLDVASILAMHRALMIEHPRMAGRWRTEQVWIGGSFFSPHGADFVAPAHQRVPEAIEDLVGFLGRDDLPAVVQAALAHAQFETIHPFPDGNGRTGRALLAAVLRARGVTRHVTAPVSSGLLARQDEYFAALGSYREGEVAPIVDLVAQAASAAAVAGGALLEDLAAVRARWQPIIAARPNSAVHKVADLLVRQPVVNSAFVSEQLGVAASISIRHLRRLTDVGILVETAGKARNRVWRAPDILEVLDDHAAAAVRRPAH